MCSWWRGDQRRRCIRRDQRADAKRHRDRSTLEWGRMRIEPVMIGCDLDLLVDLGLQRFSPSRGRMQFRLCHVGACRATTFFAFFRRR